MEYRTNSERQTRKELNQSIIEFQEEIQTIQSLSVVFEERTLFEIEKLKNSIFEVLGSNIKTRSKNEIIQQKIKEMNSFINNSFEDIKAKINSYETLSLKKIEKSQKSYENNLEKFLT
jgi:hypothetical protein